MPSDAAVDRRLHPASILLGIDLRQTIQALLFPLVAGFAAGGRAILVILAIFGVVALIGRTLAWQRFTFGFDGEVLRVEEGVLSRSHRALDVARIQQVEIDRGAVARLFGLAALRVETAGSSSEVEVELRVIPLADAEALRDELRRGKAAAGGAANDAAGDPSTPTVEPVLQVPLRQVVLASVTGARLLVFPAIVGVAFQFVGDAFGDWVAERAEDVVEGLLLGRGALDGFGWRLALLGVAVTLVASVATAVVVGVLRDAGFRIERVGDDLTVTRGLLSTRSSVVPLRRVQKVEVHRNWLRRLLGVAAVRVHSAGGSGDADRRVTVPLVSERAIDGLLAELLPGVPGVPALSPHPRAALRRTMFRWLRQAVLIGAGAIVAWRYAPFGVPDAVPWLAGGLVPLFAVLAVVEYRQLGHGLTARVVAARTGALSVVTALAPVVKVQAASTRANPLQRRLGLIIVVAHVAGPGGDVVIADTGTERGHWLLDRLTEHAAEPVAHEVRPQVLVMGGPPPPQADD